MDFAIDGELSGYFPIESQSLESDQRSLIGALLLAHEVTGRYRYLEIGSFLGGSIAPFLKDPLCEGVLSVDNRHRAQPDERGINFDYAGVSADTMIERLRRAGLDTTKLTTFDGSIDELRAGPLQYDVAFIDAEHTDEACFRDALWALRWLKPDAVLLFHDSRVIFKALRLLAIHLRHAAISFHLHKRVGSDIAAFLFGAFRRDDIAAFLGEPEDVEMFWKSAEAYRIETQFRNRARIEGLPDEFLRTARITILAPRTQKAY